MAFEMKSEPKLNAPQVRAPPVVIVIVPELELPPVEPMVMELDTVNEEPDVKVSLPRPFPEMTLPICKVAQKAGAVLSTVTVNVLLMVTLSLAVGIPAPPAPPSDNDQVEATFQFPFAAA